MSDLTTEQAAALWTYEARTACIGTAWEDVHPDCAHLTDDQIEHFASLVPVWFDAVMALHSVECDHSDRHFAFRRRLASDCCLQFRAKILDEQAERTTEAGAA